MSTTSNVQPLQNPPYSPYYNSNSGAANNVGPAVNKVNGSGMGGGTWPSGGPGGGGAGGSGNPGNAAQFNTMPIDIPAIGGGIDKLGCP